MLWYDTYVSAEVPVGKILLLLLFFTAAVVEAYELPGAL